MGGCKVKGKNIYNILKITNKINAWKYKGKIKKSLREI